MSQPGFEPLTPRYASKTCLKDEKLQKTLWHEQGLNQGPRAYEITGLTITLSG